QDAATSDKCTLNDLVERGGNVTPGSLATQLAHAICPKTPATSGACTGITGGENEVHLHVLPFGIPNFDLQLANPTDGTYTADASDIDRFLVNNRDYMVFAPVGNQGTLKVTFFASGAQEQNNKYSDLFDGTGAIAVWRSRDNDNSGPVEAILDDQNYGTSYSAGEIAGVGALIRDYLAQGFYPTGARTDADRMPTVSGPLVKAALAASANFEERQGLEYRTTGDKLVGLARAVSLFGISGVNPGVIGNNE